MISFGVIPFIIIIQLIILLFILVAFLLYLLSVKNKELQTQKNVPKSSEEASPIASVEFYLTAEIKLIESRFDLLFNEEDLKSEVSSEADWLVLRKGFLEIEKELLTTTDRVEAFWIDVGVKFQELLRECHLVKRIIVKEIQEDDEDEIKEMKQLLKSQYDDIDSLYLNLEGEKTEEEVKKIREKLSGIIRSHTELSHCIYILEDENMFLRDQIQGLLK